MQALAYGRDSTGGLLVRPVARSSRNVAGAASAEKELGDIEAGAVDEATGTTLGSEAEDVVTRSSDNESRCARWVEGSAAVDGDYAACVDYWDALRSDPAGTLNHTLSVYLVGEQYVAGALCSGVLATNPYGWIGCQVVGHILGERFGKWLAGVFGKDPEDCRGGKDNVEAFAREIYSTVADFAVDEPSARELRDLAVQQGAFFNTFLSDCGRSRNGDDYDEDFIKGILANQTAQMQAAAAEVHGRGLERVIAAGRQYAQGRAGGVASLRQFLEGNLLEARHVAAEELFNLQLMARGGVGNPVAGIPQGPQTARDEAWKASERHQAIAAAEAEWQGQNVPFAELHAPPADTGVGLGTVVAVLAAVAGGAWIFRANIARLFA